jgi:hypothetical protein
MNDPTLPLAFSLYHNKGIYALLLGSGVSRSANIPTGWEIVLDLIRKLAHLTKDDPGARPDQWYVKTFGSAPTYDGLLKQLGKTPQERRQLLHPYFEPTDSDLQEGLKRPTQAHESIASLVASGYVKVILTTNFDRLLEQSLEARGIAPTVLSRADDIHGALPLVHAPCTIIKLHGDYRDSRIRNTTDELGNYEPETDALLERVLDEFGLIISGWSGEWDQALRAALARCKSRRFSTYWTYRSTLSDEAKGLVRLRDAVEVKIKDAESFFLELGEKVKALEELEQPHPLSAKIAVASLKRYIVDPTHRIRLHDLVMEQLDSVCNALAAGPYETSGSFPKEATVLERVGRYVAETEILRSLTIHGSRWGDAEHVELWQRVLVGLARHQAGGGGLESWIYMRWFPALLTVYASGLGALAGGRLQTLAKLLMTPILIDREEVPIVRAIHPGAVMKKEIAGHLSDHSRHTPLNDFLHDTLRDSLRSLLPGDEDYENCFDRFEYLYALVHSDLRREPGERYWAPPGRFVWRWRFVEGARSRPLFSDEEAVEILEAGLFQGSDERFVDSAEALAQWCDGIKAQWGV